MTLPQFLEIPVPALSGVPAAAAGDTFGPSISRLGRMVLAESRPLVQVVCLLRVIAFVAAAGGLGRLAGTGALGMAGWSMIWMAVYVLNGVSDVDADRVNGSGRPIASGRLPAETASQAAVLLAVAGLGLCALCSGGLVLLGLAALAIGWRYSAGRAPLKTTTGGVALAGCSVVLLCYAAGAAIAGGTAPRATVAFGVAEAVWLGLCVVTKDFSDIEGDRSAGRRTWPIVLGDRPTRRLVAVASGSLAAVFAGLALLSGGGVPVAAGTAAVGSVAVSLSVLCCPTTGSRVARRLPYRTLMVTQYGLNAALLIGAVV